MSRKKKINKGHPLRRNSFKTEKQRNIAILRGQRQEMSTVKKECVAIIQMAENDKRLLEGKEHASWQPEKKEAHRVLINHCDTMIELAEANLLVTEKYVLLNRDCATSLDIHNCDRIEELDELRADVLEAHDEMRVKVRAYAATNQPLGLSE